MIRASIILVLFLIILAGCQETVIGPESSDIPTAIALAATVTASPLAKPIGQSGQTAVPPTWTPETTSAFASPTIAALPSITPPLSPTPWPTFTATAPPTNTPTNTPEASPTSPVSPTLSATLPPNPSSVNILLNPSFEQGWYHVSGYAEVQVPKNWTLGWKEGGNPLDPDPWNKYVRPESRLLNGDFLPADEHELFIWDGDYTMKVFKGSGALYFWLVTDIYLEPGSYLFNVNVFPDMVESYSSGGGKKWASDPLSGELRFIVNSEVDNWLLPQFGKKNEFSHAFEVTQAQNVRLGVAFRGRWAIENNGWFMDDWSLTQLTSPTQ